MSAGHTVTGPRLLMWLEPTSRPDLGDHEFVISADGFRGSSQFNLSFNVWQDREGTCPRHITLVMSDGQALQVLETLVITLKEKGLSQKVEALMEEIREMMGR